MEKWYSFSRKVCNVCSHEKNIPTYPSCTRSTPHTSLNVMSWQFVGLTQHFQQANVGYSDSVYTHTKPNHVAETKQMCGLFRSSQFKTTLLVESVGRTYSLRQHTTVQITED